MKSIIEGKTVQEVLDRFNNYLFFEDLSQSSKELYFRSIKSFLQEYEHNIDGVNRFIIDHGREYRSTYVRAAIIHFLRSIDKKDLIEKIVKVKKRKRKKVYIMRTPEIQKSIINNIEPKVNQLIAIIQYTTGLRASDVIRLTRDRVVIIGDEVFVKAEVKGGKEHIPLYIPREYTKTLLDYIGSRIDFLFLGTTDKDSREMKKIYQRYRRSIIKAARSVGIDHFSSHDFRHNFGSELYEKTKDILLVKDTLGHESLDTTMQYIHKKETDIKNAIKKIRESD